MRKGKPQKYTPTEAFDVFYKIKVLNEKMKDVSAETNIPIGSINNLITRTQEYLLLPDFILTVDNYVDLDEREFATELGLNPDIPILDQDDPRPEKVATIIRDHNLDYESLLSEVLDIENPSNDPEDSEDLKQAFRYGVQAGEKRTGLRRRLYDLDEMIKECQIKIKKLEEEKSCLQGELEKTEYYIAERSGTTEHQ